MCLVSLRSYIEDFRAQHYQYESHREIFMAAPTSATETGIISLRDLIDFISHVADCYPDILKDFPQELIDMLSQQHLVMEPELREKLVGSLVLLKKKDLVDSVTYALSQNAVITSFLWTANVFALQITSYSVPHSHYHPEQNPTCITFSENSVRDSHVQRQIYQPQA